ncbi:hypothetical protein GCM10023262_12460 [Bartonella pachyuromydis]|uniref:Uncharacterized protein n=1 Tax=Bartonella pachyuromydis TaxID=931097 RepID=A0ABP8VJD6_9HYPH
MSLARGGLGGAVLPCVVVLSCGVGLFCCLSFARGGLGGAVLPCVVVLSCDVVWLCRFSLV